jgi:hypothetical protein
MTRDEIDEMVSREKCPDCTSNVSMIWAVCYSPRCCGLQDRLQCERCDWESKERIAKDIGDVEWMLENKEDWE